MTLRCGKGDDVEACVVASGAAGALTGEAGTSHFKGGEIEAYGKAFVDEGNEVEEEFVAFGCEFLVGHLYSGMVKVVVSPIAFL